MGFSRQEYWSGVPLPSPSDRLSGAICDNLEGWNGEGGGREIQEEGDMFTYDRFMLLYGRNQHNIVKQLSFN